MQAFKDSILFSTPLSLLVLLVCLPTVAAPAANDESEQIETHITGLDSGKYVEREKATDQLVAFGRASLKPVALRYLDADPETAWRIKRILKRIATEAQQELTSLQAIGVLIVLDQKWDGELSGLLSKWRENRSQRAIEYLIEKGASTSPSGIQRQMFFAGFDGQLPISGDGTGDNPLRDDPQRPRTEEQARTDIEEIVSGDFESVQDFVFTRLPRGSVNDQPARPPQILVNGRQVIFGANEDAPNWTFVEIGEKWTGDEQDLERLTEIHSLAAVRFVNQELPQSVEQLIGKLQNLQHFGFVNSNLDDSESITDIDLPAGINSLELGNIRIDEGVVKWLTNIPLASLTLEKCQVENNAGENFQDLQQLNSLDLRHVNINRELFRNLAELTSLKRLYLSVCKFKGDDFRAFSRVRPRVAVFNPVSFLGVQARPTGSGAENWSCEIEMVVPESAADEAGIRAGDIIESVNGDPVVTFQDLRMYISQHEVGEEMKLDVERSGQKIELTAVLGSIEDR